MSKKFLSVNRHEIYNNASFLTLFAFYVLNEKSIARQEIYVRILSEINGTKGREARLATTYVHHFLSLHLCTPGKRQSSAMSGGDQKRSESRILFPCACGKSRWLHRSPIFFRGINTRRARIHAPCESFALQTSKLPAARRIIQSVYRGIPCLLLRRVPRGREEATRAYRCASTNARGNYVLTVQHYRRQGTHPARGGNGGSTRESAGRRGHRRVAARTAICTCANTRAHERMLHAVLVASVGTRLAVPSLAAGGRPRFGTGIGHFSNRKSGVSRYTRCKRVCVYVISDGPVCMWHETKLERQVQQSGALPAARSGHSFDYYCRSALFFHPASAGLSYSLARVYGFFCLYERTHARTSAPVLTARAAVSRQCQRMRTYVHMYAMDGLRGNLDARGVVNDVSATSHDGRRAAFLPSASLPRTIVRFLETRYCRRLSGIVRRPLILVSRLSRFS